MNPFRFRIYPVYLKTLFCYGLFFFVATAAISEPLEWSGSIKSLNIHTRGIANGIVPDNTISNNQVRGNIDLKPDNSWQLETAINYNYLWTDPPSTFQPRTDIYNRKLDLEKVWQHHNRGIGLLQADRANIQWRGEAVDLTLGRQAIGFGRILIFSPLDIIAPFAPDAIDTDVRRGVDAIRSVLSYGLDGQVGAFAVFGAENEFNSYLGTWSDNRSGCDLLLIGGELRDRKMLGFGLAGDLGSVGLKGEISFYEGKNTDKVSGDRSDSFSIAALETWYRFANGLSLVMQYLYNGPGSKNPRDYPQVLASAPLQEGMTFLLGQNYLFAAPSYDLHPLATFQGLVIYNLDDKSALLRPTLDISLTNDFSLELFWTWYTGKRPQETTSGHAAVPRSEFGLIKDSGGIFLTWYF